MTAKLHIEVSNCDSDDESDEVLLEVLQRLDGINADIRYSSGDTHIRTFATPWDYER